MLSKPERTTLFLALLFCSCGFARGQTERVSVDSNGVQANGDNIDCGLSADGRLIVFLSRADNLDPGDGNGAQDILLHDRSTNVTRLVNVDSNGIQANEQSRMPAISSDGSAVVFASEADNLVVGDTNALEDIIVHDLSSGLTTRASVSSSGNQGNHISYQPDISATGRFVIFTTIADNLVPGDNNGTPDVLVHDRQTQETFRVSMAHDGSEANADCYDGSISADGRYVVFESYADNLVPGDVNGQTDVFLRDLTLNTTERISLSTDGTEGNGRSSDPHISDDGRYVVFASAASNLVPDDTNDTEDVFLVDLTTRETIRVSVDSCDNQANADSCEPRLSANGRFVVFLSEATNFHAGGRDGSEHAYVRDLENDITMLMSCDDNGSVGDDDSDHCHVANSGVAAFTSDATNLVPGDTNDADDVFVRTPALMSPGSWTLYGEGWSGTHGVPSLSLSGTLLIGSPLTLEANNSQGTDTSGLILIGFCPAQADTNLGGTLHVLLHKMQTVSIPASGLSANVDIPDDEFLRGLSIYLQLLQEDIGASHGYSFTPGLHLMIGP